jgi:putative ATPase
MKELNYGKDYKYAHNYKDNFVEQEYLPKELIDKRIWKTQDNPAEQRMGELMKKRWKNRY